MTSNAQRMLQGLLSLAVVSAAAGAHAQNLETPGAPAAEAAAAPAAAGPSGFGDSGQFVLSAERLFGYTWDHPSQGSSVSTFSLLASPFLGVSVNPYDWPRLGFDYFVTKSISGGLAVGFSRTTGGNSSTNAFEVAPRLGYGMMVGPWLAVWPRLGVTYVNATSQSYLALTIDLAAVIQVSSHLAVTFAPNTNIGLTGKQGTNTLKFTTLGAQFGLAIPF